MNRIERRGSDRRPPSYTPEEIDALRISRIHFREDYMFSLMSDGTVVCVPLAISPALLAAPLQLRYQWRIVDDGKAVVWFTKGMGMATERLSLSSIIAHPEAQMIDLPGDSVARS
jgi:hypothetical protein